MTEGTSLEGTSAPGAADFVAERHGGLVKVIPLTARAHEWLAEKTTLEAGRFEGGLVVELRYFGRFAEGILESGMTFGRDRLPDQVPGRAAPAR